MALNRSMLHPFLSVLALKVVYSINTLIALNIYLTRENPNTQYLDIGITGANTCNAHYYHKTYRMILECKKKQCRNINITLSYSLT